MPPQPRELYQMHWRSGISRRVYLWQIHEF